MMPYGDANAIVMDMAREVLPVARRTPVLAGVCGTDPFRLMPRFLEEVKAARASPACRTSPPSGSSTAPSAPGVEETGMGYGLEVDMIRTGARARPAHLPVRLHRGRGARDGRRRRGRARPAHGAHDRRHDRGADRPHARRGGRAGAGAPRRRARGEPGRPLPLPRRARSPSPTTRPTSSPTRPASSASSAPPAWSGCRPRSP